MTEVGPPHELLLCFFRPPGTQLARPGAPGFEGRPLLGMGALEGVDGPRGVGGHLLLVTGKTRLAAVQSE